MGIKHLTLSIAPPTTPLNSEAGDQWLEVQRLLGTSLPTDLREYGRAYGTGRFSDGLISIANPFSPVYVEAVQKRLGAIQDAIKYGYELPYRIFPEKGGIFPVGSDENGNRLYWLTEGSPDDWPLLLGAHSSGYERWDLSLTDFLALALTNKIKTIIWKKFRPSQQNFVQVDY